MGITLVLLLIPTIISALNSIFGREKNCLVFGIYYTIAMLILFFSGLDYSFSIEACAMLSTFNNISYLLFNIKGETIEKYVEKNLIGAFILILINIAGFIFKWWTIGRLIFLIF